MKFFSQIQKTDILLALFGLCFVIFGWYSLSLALGSLFLSPFVAVGFVLSLILCLYVGWRLLLHAPLDFRIVFITALTYAAVIASFSEPTVFSGRDQGSISEAAFRLAENGQLAFSSPASDAFFNIYGEGTALNFPGFAYAENGALLTQFPLGYTSWLASFISLFGLSGFAIANGALLFLFLLVFYGLLRLFVHPFYALWGFALAMFSFLPTWFAKMTVTENLSLFLFVFLLYSLILFLREGKFVYYAGTLLTGALFAFTRLEGFAFLAIALVIMFFSPHSRAIWKTYPLKSLFIPGIVFLFYFLRDFFLNLPYYKMAGKGLFKASDSVTAAAISGDSFALGSVFFLYGLLFIFLIGLFAILVFIKEKRYEFLLPTLIALPTFLYLFFPNITPDHPWMLRRYLFSLYPTLLFSTVVGIALIFQKEKDQEIRRPEGKRLFFVSTIFLSFLLLQYTAWSSLLFKNETTGLLKQVEAFNGKFSEKDLVLVDRFSTGNNFAMLTGPSQFIHGNNVVYFFNPHDLEKLDLSAFENVYLLAPEDSISRYSAVFGSRLAFESLVTFSYEQIERLPLNLTSSLRLPQTEKIEMKNTLFQIY